MSISGSVVFEISGRNISRFVSRCARDGIRLRSVRTIHGSKMPSVSVCTDTEFAKPLLKVAGDCRLRVHIKKRKGVLFFIKKHRRRKVLMVCWLLPVIMLTILSRFVWFIDVQGLNVLTPEKAKEVLEDVGIRRFMPIDREKINRMSRELSKHETGIAGAVISVDGVKMTVNIREAVNPKDETDSDFSNIYARCDGVIQEILTYSGTAVVKEGDIVKSGDLLISGDISTEDKVIRIKADGKVKAHVAHTFYGQAGPALPAKVRSGKTETRTRLEFFGFGLQKSSFTEYEMQYNSQVYSDALSVLFPIRCASVTLYELADGYEDAEYDELLRTATEKAQDNMLHGLPKTAVIVSKTTTTQTMPSGEVCVILSVITEEEIAVGG